MPSKLSRNNDDKTDLIDSLHDLIMDLTIESMESNYSDDEQKKIHRHAKEVRKRRITLRAVQFDKNTRGYQDAIKSLDGINTIIEESIDRINNLINFFDDLSKLVAALDKIIQASAISAI